MLEQIIKIMFLFILGTVTFKYREQIKNLFRGQIENFQIQNSRNYITEFEFEGVDTYQLLPYKDALRSAFASALVMDASHIDLSMINQTNQVLLSFTYPLQYVYTKGDMRKLYDSCTSKSESEQIVLQYGSLSERDGVTEYEYRFFMVMLRRLYFSNLANIPGLDKLLGFKKHCQWCKALYPQEELQKFGRKKYYWYCKKFLCNQMAYLNN